MDELEVFRRLGPQSPGVSLSDWLSLTALALIWGTAFAFTKVALTSLGPLSVAAARISLAALVLSSVARARGLALPREPGHWAFASLIALFGNALPFFAISWGQERVDSGLAGLLMAVMPLVTLLLAHFFTRDDHLSVGKVVGFMLGLAGVAVLVGPEALHGLGASSDAWRQLAILGGAVCYAVAAILTRRMPRRAVMVSSASVMLVAAAFMFPIALVVDRPWQQEVQAKAVLAAVWLGAMPTALATLVYFRVVQRVGPTFLSQINFLIPVVALTVGVVVLGEPPEAELFYALVLILAGLGLARPRRAKLEQRERLRARDAAS